MRLDEDQLNLILHHINELQRTIYMSTVGIANLTQAVTDLTTAVTSETADVSAAATAIAAVVTQLQNNEDPQVVALAAQIEAQVALINTANGNIVTATSSLTPPTGTVAG